MTPRCKICCTPADPGAWKAPDQCDVCADVTPEVLAAARAAAFRVKDYGPSATKDLTRYAHAIAGAVLRVAGKPTKKRKVRA